MTTTLTDTGATLKKEEAIRAMEAGTPIAWKAPTSKRLATKGVIVAIEDSTAKLTSRKVTKVKVRLTRHYVNLGESNADNNFVMAKDGPLSHLVSDWSSYYELEKAKQIEQRKKMREQKGQEAQASKQVIAGLKNIQGQCEDINRILRRITLPPGSNTNAAVAEISSEADRLLYLHSTLGDEAFTNQAKIGISCEAIITLLNALRGNIQ